MNSFQMNNTVGNTLEYIDGSRPKCRLEECQFGNFIADAMAEEMKVGIAVMNSGGIKGSFNKGFFSFKTKAVKMFFDPFLA